MFLCFLEGRDSEGVWEGHAHTAMFETDNQQGPAVEHRKLLSVLWQPGQEGSEEEWIHACVWLSPLTVHLKLL